MAQRIRLAGLLFTSLALLALTTPARAVLPTPACLERATPVAFEDAGITAVARDGSTMIGFHNATLRPLMWRKDESGIFRLESFPFPPDVVQITLRAVSNEGRVIVGDARPVDTSLGSTRAFRWTAATGMEYLDTGFPHGSNATDVSADGIRVVGSYAHPIEGDLFCGNPVLRSGFLWEGAGFTQLAAAPARGFPLPEAGEDGFVNPVGGESRVRSSALAISSDGETIVGESLESYLVLDEIAPGTIQCKGLGGGVQEAVVWPGGGAPTLLGQIGITVCSRGLGDRPPLSIATGVSSDGAVIIGHATDDCDIFQVKWLQGIGPIAVLGEPTTRVGDAVTEDGTTILATLKRSGELGSDVWAFEDKPVPRLLDDILTRDFCVELGPRKIVDIDDITNLAGGGVVVFVSDPAPPSGSLTQEFVVLPCRDPDEDNLCSEWEKMGGIDLDGDGQIQGPPQGGDLVLAGADPMHKDIFVEVDEIDGSLVFFEALADVEKAFSIVPNSLIGNPDGKPGVNLHLELGGDSDLQLMSGTNQWGPSPADCSMPTDMLFFRSQKFGTPAERSHPAVIEAKSSLYRYLVFGGVHPNGWSGEAEAFGNDAIVTLANWPTPDGTREEQAGTIMHELGHNFGLRHGGNQHANYKPNYHSVMNYTWQFRGSKTVDTTLGQKAHEASWILDYSRRPFLPLAELLLSELDGIGGSLFHFVPAGPMRPCVLAGAAFCARLVNEGIRIDWDEDTVIDSDPVGPINVNEVVLGKGGGADEVLLPAEDWSTVADLYQDFRHPNWKIGTTGTDSCQNFGDSLEEARQGLVDMTEQDIEEIVNQPFAIDCNENGIVDDEELDAGSDTDSNGNGVLDGCEPLPGDIDLDEDVDEDDRQLLIASFGRGEGEDEYLELADLDLDRTVTFVDYQEWGGALSPLTLGAGEATVRFEPSLATVPLGEDVLVEIVADLGSPVLGFGLDFGFDSAVVGVVGSPEIGPEWQAAFATDGDQLVGVGPTAGVSGSEVLLARITLRALRPGVSDLVVSTTDDDLAEGLPLEGVGFAAMTFETGQVRVPEPGLVGLLAALLLLRTIRGRMDSRDTSDRSSRKTPIESL